MNYAAKIIPGTVVQFKCGGPTGVIESREGEMFRVVYECRGRMRCIAVRGDAIEIAPQSAPLSPARRAGFRQEED